MHHQGIKCLAPGLHASAHAPDGLIEGDVDGAGRYLVGVQWHPEEVGEEVVPFTLAHNANPFLIATGPSFGAYHAVTFALRHPHLVGRVLGMSGIYDITRFTDGYRDDSVYSYNPISFVANEHDPARL